MFIVKRKELFTFDIGLSTHEVVEEYVKNFFDKDFLMILNFINNKGLDFPIPTILDGWDASFIYRKLKEQDFLGRPGYELAHFLYMRLNKKEPIYIEQKAMFGIIV